MVVDLSRLRGDSSTESVTLLQRARLDYGVGVRLVYGGEESSTQG